MRILLAAIIFSLTLQSVQAEPLKINCPPQSVTQIFRIDGVSDDLKGSLNLAIPDHPEKDKIETTIEEKKDTDDDPAYIMFEGQKYIKQQLTSNSKDANIYEYLYSGKQIIDKYKAKINGKKILIEHDLCINETITIKCPKITISNCSVGVSRFSQLFCDDNQASMKIYYELTGCESTGSVNP